MAHGRMGHLLGTLLVIFTLSGPAMLGGCGGAPPGGTGDGGDGGGTTLMPPEERKPAMDAVSGFVADLTGADPAADDAAIAAFLATRPEFEASGVSETGGAWARFTDGTMALIINNADELPEEEDAAAQAFEPRAARYGEPHGQKARILRSMGTAFPNCVPNITSWLTDAGYTMSGGSANVATLSAIAGDGIFYIHGHGGAGVEKDGDVAATYALWTLDLYTAANDAAFATDLADNSLCYMCAKQDTGQPAEWHYAITPKFVTKHMSFGENSLVLIHGCNGNSGAAASFRDACFSKGASLYAGWTDVVMSNDSARASRFVFDRLLGSNKGPSPEDPKQRPFDYKTVWADLTSRRWDTSNAEGHGTAKFVFTEKAGDCAILAPSIRFLTVHETTETGAASAELTIDGMFGEGLDDSNCKVTLGGTEVAVTQFGATSLECEIPDSGGGSSGDVQVEVHKHKSNKAPLTDWRGTIRYSMQVREYPYYEKVTMDLHYRADIHPHRDAPQQRPNYPIVSVYPVGDSTCTYEAGGSAPAGEATVTWTGSGELPYAASAAQAGQDHYAAPISISTYEDSSANTMRVHLNAFSAQGLTIHMVHPQYTQDTPMILALVFRYDGTDDQGAYVDMSLGGDYSIPAFSREGLTESPSSEPADWLLEWDAISPTTAPDPEVHASGLLTRGRLPGLDWLGR